MKKELAKLVLLSIVIGLLMISLSFANGGRSSGFVTKRLLAFQTSAMDMEKLINIENCYLPIISKYAPEQLSEWQIVFKERKEILSSPEARELIKQINEIDKELEELKEKVISGEIEENKIIEKVMQILNELEELGINTKKAREWQKEMESLNLRLSAALEAENQVEITKILKRMFKLEEERNEQLKSNLFKNKEQSQLILQNQDRTE
jgi:sugar-specific transcriptional regulator TrmB